MVAEHCDECRFDGGRWTDQDVLTTLGVLGPLWDGYLEGADERVLHTRPSPEQWSIAEYTDHLGQTLWAMRFLVAVARETPGHDLGEVHGRPFDPEPAAVDLAAARARLSDEAARLAAALAEVEVQQWPTATVAFTDQIVDLGWIGRHGMHDAMHHLHDVGRIRVALGDGVPHQLGEVSHLAVSGGGVPKRGVDRIEVGWSGADGDVQTDRRHHGRPFQALSLWSEEVIAALRAEGHPIEAGLAGENVTVTGVDWTHAAARHADPGGHGGGRDLVVRHPVCQERRLVRRWPLPSHGPRRPPGLEPPLRHGAATRTRPTGRRRRDRADSTALRSASLPAGAFGIWVSSVPRSGLAASAFWAPGRSVAHRQAEGEVAGRVGHPPLQPEPGLGQLGFHPGAAGTWR